MKKRTKILILVAMVLLLGVTGYLNIVLNSATNETEPTVTTTASYFETYRSDRETTRDQELFKLVREGGISYELVRPKNLYFMWYFKIIGQRRILKRNF